MNKWVHICSILSIVGLSVWLGLIELSTESSKCERIFVLANTGLLVVILSALANLAALMVTILKGDIEASMRVPAVNKCTHIIVGTSLLTMVGLFVASFFLIEAPTSEVESMTVHIFRYIYLVLVPLMVLAIIIRAIKNRD